MVTFLEFGEDLGVVAGLASFEGFGVAALGAGFGGCVKVDFEGGVVEDDCADVASDHDDAAICPLRHVSLHCDEDAADAGEDGDAGCGGCDFGGGDHIADVLAVYGYAGVIDGDFRALRQGDNGVFGPVLQIGSQGEQADGAVEEAGIDKSPSEGLGDAAPDGGLAGRDGAVEGDGAWMCHGCAPCARVYGRESCHNLAMNNWVDFVILAALAAPAFGGLRVGLIKAVTSFASIIIGITLATLFWRQAAALVEAFVSDERLAAFIGYSSIVLVVIIIGVVVAFFLRTLLTMLLLGWVDKVGGVVFGLAIGSIIVATMIFALESFGGTFGKEALAGSALSGYFDFLVPILREVAGDIDLPSVSPSNVVDLVRSDG